MSAAATTAMLLAAGEGRRLRPLTEHTPKPMLEVAGEPLIAHHVRWLVSNGIERIVVNLHHLGNQIREFLGDGTRFGVEVLYSEEPALLETGGGIVHALPLLGDAPFVVLNADVWLEPDQIDLATDLKPGALAHLVLTERPEFRERGDFDAADGWVTARGDAYVYCGLSVHHPALFAGRQPEPFSLRDLWFEALTDRRVSAQIYSGYWTDIGTPDQLHALRAHLADA